MAKSKVHEIGKGGITVERMTGTLPRTEYILAQDCHSTETQVPCTYFAIRPEFGMIRKRVKALQAAEAELKPELLAREFKDKEIAKGSAIEDWRKYIRWFGEEGKRGDEAAYQWLNDKTGLKFNTMQTSVCNYKKGKTNRG